MLGAPAHERYAFHPEAFTDLDQLWEYIAEHNVDAADRVVADIFATLRTLVAYLTSRGLRCLLTGR